MAAIGWRVGLTAAVSVAALILAAKVGEDVFQHAIARSISVLGQNDKDMLTVAFPPARPISGRRNRSSRDGGLP